MRRNALASILVLLGAATAVAGIGPAETVVLVNAKSPDSRRVAAHYVGARNIPVENVCEVTCEPALEISMDDFVRDVVDPVRNFLRARDLEGRCTALVLTQGMPILARTPGGAVSTSAALSLLDTEICGQPQTRMPTMANQYTSGVAPVQPLFGTGRFLLVTALVSTTADEAIAMIDRSVAGDGTAPPKARFIFQDAKGAAGVRNDKYDAARKELEERGFATEHAVQEDPKSPVVNGRVAVMGYMSGGSYSNLTPAGVATNEYLPGAICDMLQSYGAVPANFTPGATGQQQFPVTHMIRAGITGVHGAVAEPYNVAFPSADLFRPYVDGYTLAETFHQRMPLMYWMNLTLGDPLCAPYAKRPKPSVASRSHADGTFTFDVAAADATRIDVYVDGRLAGSVDGSSGSVALDTANWPHAAKHRVLVEATGAGAAEPRGWAASEVAWPQPKARAAVAAPPRVTFDGFVVKAPAAIAAGEIFNVQAAVVGADGKRVEEWKGRVEMRSIVPPVRWARVDSPTPAVSMECRLTKAGDYELRIAAPDDGLGIAIRVHVDPGPLHHATCPADSFPLGQECDLEVVLEDAFGNRLTKYDGVLELSVPNDPEATLPAPLQMTTGRGVFRDVTLLHPGPTGLLVTDGSGQAVSQKGEGVTVGKAAIRPWLVAGPGPAKTLFAADPSAAATAEGSVVAKLPLKRRSGGDVVELPPGNAKGGDAAVLVTWVEAKAATKARLLAAAPGRLRVFLDGKQVFDGVAKTLDAKGKREPIAELSLAEGTHRLAVIAETKGPTSASIEIDDGADKFPPSLRIRARRGDAPPK